MTEKIISFALLLLCSVRTISYVVFTFKHKNTSGGVGIILLLAAAVACGIVFLI